MTKEEKERLLSLANEKLDEMQAELEKKKEGFFNKIVFNKNELAMSEAVIKRTKEMIVEGSLPNMHSIKRRVKFASAVDLSGFPKEDGKNLYANLHTFGGGA